MAYRTYLIAPSANNVELLTPAALLKLGLSPAASEQVGRLLHLRFGSKKIVFCAELTELSRRSTRHRTVKSLGRDVNARSKSFERTGAKVPYSGQGRD